MKLVLGFSGTELYFVLPAVLMKNTLVLKIILGTYPSPKSTLTFFSTLNIATVQA